MTTTQESEKRKFQRIAINLTGDLLISGQLVKVDVLDLSLKGVRIKVPAYINHHEEQVTLSFRANGDSPEISITGKFTHHYTPSQGKVTQEAGMRISHIALDDLSMLRRMLLLNGENEHLDMTELAVLLDQLSIASQQQ